MATDALAASRRLTQPLIRRGGTLTPASWEEALGLAAEKLGALKATYGPEAFGLYSCSKTTNELNFLAGKFARVAIGTHNVDSCNRT